MRFHKIDKGRWCLNLGKGKWGDNQIRLEVSRTHNFGIGWRIQREERELQFSWYLLKIFSIWLTFDLKAFKYIPEPIAIAGFNWQVKDHVIHIQVMDESSFDSSKKRLLYVYWNYRDFLFGRATYSEGRTQTKYTKLTMPEGEYVIRLDYNTAYWHRPRSPFVKAVKRVEVTPNRPIPIPGKGENSWDLDEDATFNISMPVRDRTDEQILDDVKSDILKTRERRAGKNWKPEKLWDIQEGFKKDLPKADTLGAAA